MALAVWAISVLSAGIYPAQADEGLPTVDTCTGQGCSQAVGGQTGNSQEPQQSSSQIVDQMCELDRKNADFNAEIASQRRAIADMERILAASREPGGAVPDINRLKAQGVAGQGIVGAGRSKPQHIRDAISEYESKLNPQNYLGIVRLSNNITKERNRLKAERKAALGLGESGTLPQSELDAIENMAGGRAFYGNEIARSGEFIARLQGKIKKGNQERSSIRSSMTDDEFEEYKRQRPSCSTPTQPGSGTNSATSSSSGGGQSNTGPCPAVPGWSVPAEATCTSS